MPNCAYKVPESARCWASRGTKHTQDAASQRALDREKRTLGSPTGSHRAAADAQHEGVLLATRYANVVHRPQWRGLSFSRANKDATIAERRLARKTHPQLPTHLSAPCGAGRPGCQQSWANINSTLQCTGVLTGCGTSASACMHHFCIMVGLGLGKKRSRCGEAEPRLGARSSTTAWQRCILLQPMKPMPARLSQARVPHARMPVCRPSSCKWGLGGCSPVFRAVCLSVCQPCRLRAGSGAACSCRLVVNTSVENSKRMWNKRGWNSSCAWCMVPGGRKIVKNQGSRMPASKAETHVVQHGQASLSWVSREGPVWDALWQSTCALHGAAWQPKTQGVLGGAA